MARQSLITLTTDFGLQDEYVGVMKGVILTRAPSATIVDLNHNILPQDVRQAAFTLQSACRFFPPGTIHLIVVDPEVGSGRKILLLRAADQLFLAPDNGVLDFFLDGRHFQEAYILNRPDLYLQPVSDTFHGRDIFAPAAAFLANGGHPADLGPTVPAAALRRIAAPPLQLDAGQGTIAGSVVHIDHYGNLTTNLRRDHISRVFPGESPLRITVGTRELTGIARGYSQTAAGGVIALFGSRDLLEIAVYQGNAASLLKVHEGDPVTIMALKTTK
jgi:hypothetical protein